MAFFAVVAERIDVHSSLSPGTRSGMTNCLWSDLKHHHLLNNIPWRDSSFFCGPIDIHWPRMAQLAAAAVALNKKTNFGNDTGHFFTNLYSLLCLWSTVPSAWSSGNEYVLRILLILKLALIGKLKLATLTHAMLTLVLCLCILVHITKIIKSTRVCMMTKFLLEDTLMVMCALRRHASSIVRRRHHAAFCPLIIIVAGYMVHQT